MEQLNCNQNSDDQTFIMFHFLRQPSYLKAGKFSSYPFRMRGQSEWTVLHAWWLRILTFLTSPPGLRAREPPWFHYSKLDVTSCCDLSAKFNSDTAGLLATLQEINTAFPCRRALSSEHFVTFQSKGHGMWKWVTEKTRSTEEKY